MKIRRKLVECLVEIYPTVYLSLVVIEHGIRLLHLNILRETNEMLESSMLWYRKFEVT